MVGQPIAEYLSGHPFFAVLDAASVKELAGCARNAHVRAGDYLFREGGDAKHFYVIITAASHCNCTARAPARSSWTRSAMARCWTGRG